MARRKHHATAGRALSWVILAAVAGGLGLGACFVLRGDEAPAGRRPPPVPDFAFQVGFVKAVAVGDKPPTAEIEGTRDEIAAVLEDLYTTAFVDPRGWEGGAFPSLPSYFTGAAADRAADEIENLTIGSLAPSIRRVEPGPSRLEVSLLIDEESRPSAAIAQVAFRANATTKGGEPFAIFHRGRYLLRPESGSWLIFAYDVLGEINSGAGKGPQPGPSPEATP